MVQAWADKVPVQMISMINEAEMVNTGRKDGKSNQEIKKPCNTINS
jgi:hypothetical protein